MNLLIVDDEIVALQGILDGPDFKAIGYDHVFTANSYVQALNVFLNEHIDVLLCDIEMPYGNGIDLGRWVSQHHPEVILIFLSCHDEFDYAHQAILLECLDYVLKPATTEVLTDVLTRAVKKLNETRRNQQYQNYGKVYLNTITEAQKKDDSDNVLDLAQKYINENLAEQLSVEDIAKRLYVSPDHLTRLFRKQYGQTVIAYITDQRMKLAKELIRQQVLTLNAVAAAVGYRDYSYFTRVFKKYEGITPGAFLQMQKKEK